jgi:hypothetical protein
MAESIGSKKVTIHTDGACDGNPGPGGWAAVLRFGEHVRELTGGEPVTTNNRMELQAAISALKALKEACDVTPFPRPVPKGGVAQHGIYGLIRYPLYTAVFCASVGGA